MMSELVVPSASQLNIVKFISNKNVKAAEILIRHSAQFGDETLSQTQMYGWNQSFKEGQAD
jgi:hypothetical protein